jgi:ABC-type nitrate/sulfonate/bicarbonate transport system permease component
MVSMTSNAPEGAVMLFTSAKRLTRSHRFRDACLRATSIGLFIAIWYAISLANKHWLHVFNPMLIPTPSDVVEAGIQLVKTGQLQQDIVASSMRVLVGFLIAGVVGLAVGVAVATWRPLEALFAPVIELLRSIPPLAFLPMMVLWFGIGEASKIAFIAYTSFFPMFITTVEGIKFVDPVLVRAAAALGATPWQTFRHVTLPAALPSIITGLRLAFSLAFFVIVAAEFVAADSGLGYMINDARTFFMVPQMLLGAIVIGAIGFLFNFVLQSLERFLLQWRRTART